MIERVLRNKLTLVLCCACLLTALSCGPGGLKTNTGHATTRTTSATTSVKSLTTTALATTSTATTSVKISGGINSSISGTVPKTTNVAATTAFDASKALQGFLTSTNRHLKLHYEAWVSDGTSPAEVGDYEIWQKPSAMRLDYYKGGALNRTILVNRDVANYYMWSSRSVIPSTQPAAYYFALFNQDYSKAVPAAGGAYKIAVNTFYKSPSGTAGYYITEIKYSFDDGGVLTQLVYGNSSTGAKPTTVNSVIHTFSLVQNDAVIADSLFAPPF
jgi:hypothetical protein